MQPLGLPHRVDRHDVRVVQVGDGDRLVPEALDHPVAQQQARRHHLDRHLSVERDLVGQEDRGHAAASQLAADLELAQRRAAEPLDHSAIGERRPRGGEVDQDGGFGGSAAVRAGQIAGKQRPAHGRTPATRRRTEGSSDRRSPNRRRSAHTSGSQPCSAGVEPNFPVLFCRAAREPRAT